MGWFLPSGYTGAGELIEISGGSAGWALTPAGGRVRIRFVAVVDERARDRLVEVTEILAALRHPALARPEQLLLTDDGVLVVEEAQADLSGRSLPAEQIAALVVRLASALSALHRCGVAQGRLTAQDVLIDAQGVLRLSAGGLVVAGSGIAADGRFDGRALAALATELAEELPEQFAEELAEAATRAETPAELAARLQQLAPPPSPAQAAMRPLPSRVEARRRRRRRGRSRTGARLAFEGLAAALLGCAALWTGLRWGSAGAPPPARPAAVHRPLTGRAVRVVRTGDPSQGSWLAVLERIAAARSAAFATATPAALTDCEVVGGPAWRVDQTLLKQLAAAGLRISGLPVRVLSVRLRSRNAGSAVLAVREELSSYFELNASGSVIHTVPAGPVGSYLYRLTKSPEGWLVSSVTAG
ncbi:MAG: protein kinase family protein [Mycobacteriales bacterium]